MRKDAKRPKPVSFAHILSFLLLIVPLPFTAALCQATPTTKHPAMVSAPYEPQASLPIPVGQQGNWNLIFHDEFNGNSLDTTKWNTCYYNFMLDHGCIHDQGELEFYQPGAVTVSNGSVKLKAQKSPFAASNGKTYPYTSGMITTGPSVGNPKDTRFAFKYGYMEMRAKVPAGKGLWPAFWTLPANLGWPPEIDVFEILGDQPNVVNLHYHYETPNGGDGDSPGSWVGPDFSADWHTYAVDWEPHSITWYIDGVARRTFTDQDLIPAAPMYLVANLAVGGSWPGSPDASTHFPAAFEIDYVRVWQHAR